MTRLDTIVVRQRGTRARDFLFAAVVALAAAISVASVASAARAAAPHITAL